ncbi:hypothetical protein ACQWHL_25080, partial [Salmonella enterica subsp. enterica serovar Infantis]
NPTHFNQDQRNTQKKLPQRPHTNLKKTAYILNKHKKNAVHHQTIIKKIAKNFKPPNIRSKISPQ